jgi:cystathionine beta-synthase
MQNSLLESVGQTPLVRLNKIPHLYGTECQILAKCEYLNPSGSIKDRIVLKMIESAEREGKLKPGHSELVEPTSGNTGIAMAMIGSAIKGYPVTACMKQKNSLEKQWTMELLGANVVKTPTNVPADSPLNHIKTAYSMANSKPNSAVILDQYSNNSNVLAHYQGTAQEIAVQCNYAVDAVVIGVGTGGTITGVAERLKQLIPGVQIIAAEPEYSSLIEGGLRKNPQTGEYQVEGIGYDFVPSILRPSIVDAWIQVADRDSFVMARALAAKEGFLCGGSSGSTAFAAIKWAKSQGWDSSRRIVAIFADSQRNYLSKHSNDYWMLKNGYSTDLMQKRNYLPLISTLQLATLPIIPQVNDQMNARAVFEAFFDFPLVQVEGSEMFIEQSCFAKAFLSGELQKPSTLALTLKELQCTFALESNELADLKRLLVLFEYYSYALIRDKRVFSLRLLKRETLYRCLSRLDTECSKE